MPRPRPKYRRRLSLILPDPAPLTIFTHFMYHFTHVLGRYLSLTSTEYPDSALLPHSVRGSDRPQAHGFPIRMERQRVASLQMHLIAYGVRDHHATRSIERYCRLHKWCLQWHFTIKN